MTPLMMYFEFLFKGGVFSPIISIQNQSDGVGTQNILHLQDLTYVPKQTSVCFYYTILI